MKNIVLLAYLFTLNCFITSAQEINLINLLHDQENKIDECYSDIINDTLIIGNKFIERKYKWNNGNLVSINIKNKVTDKTILFRDTKRPDFNIKTLTSKSLDVKYTSKKIKNSSIIPAHLEIEVVSTFDSLMLKRVFKIFPASLAIACDYYIKSIYNNTEILPQDIKAENMFLLSLHWKLNAVEFFDITDKNNNLTRTESLIPYKEDFLKGNILYLDNSIDSKGFFFLKEAPCSFAQNNYPGYDFKTKSYARKGFIEISTQGLGVSGNDLIKDQWVKCFSVVSGVHNNTEKSKRIALRSYQKNTRILKPERDEMLMVNSWGDRSKDSKINEVFIKEELMLAKKFDFTHYSIDDGWQQGLSRNSANTVGKLWDQWEIKDWQPNKERFPNGFEPIIKLADSLNIQLGLWFHPSNENEYKNWQQDADILIGLFHQYGIKYIKIDGVKIPTKKADINLQRFFDKVLKETNDQIVFSLDATADNRYGYHYNTYLGNIFLENRYTDYNSYYPYMTHRNVWMLSKYLPIERLQIEFLNKWRNIEKYGNDPLAPSQYSFDYLFAITIPGQPLAWFESSGLPKEALKTINWFKIFNSIRTELHSSYIFPIGNEPSGTSYTGFQFIKSDSEGYILVFRELNKNSEFIIPTMLEPGQNIDFIKVYGKGNDFNAIVMSEGKVKFNLDYKNSFCLYKYRLK